MKSKLLLLSALATLWLRSAQAQGPTITATGTIGDVFTNQWVHVGGVTPGGSGANQTWDFSGVVDSGSSVTVSIVSPASTPSADASYFPGATSAARYSYDSSIEYFTSSSNILYNDGGVSDSSHTIFSSPPQQFVFPLSYGNVTGSAVAGTYTSTTRSGTITGTDSTWADGYGTLILPGRTYTNVLRTRNVLVQNIVVSGFTLTIVNEQYNYLVEGYDFFVFEISSTTTSFGGNSTTITLALYGKNIPNGINQINPDIALDIYPNPARNSFTLKTNEADIKDGATLEVSDLTGRTIAEAKVSSAVQNVDLSDAGRGMYLVTIKTANGIASRKLTIE